ncbi:DUF5938 domain-containing protein [Thalassotalea nanhaiensis]|uniref:DUF5938 domain-containing protein n=1 Tax=Thalassotalea nanhaiensis TaxID=3065648 RepID=A0ABY9TE94_9GAMM|nr:DUF5938 domain-containing protein [Colwelliaceae bacterium SQ345]
MTNKSVVLYGASGYTGKLVAEFLREYGISFIAAGRDAEKIKAAMATVPGIETADYEVVQVEHTKKALTELFKGAKVICNTVGPFMYFGQPVVEAALEAGCHYLDTGGEMNFITKIQEELGPKFAEKNLVLAPGTSYMYTSLEIGAHMVLEQSQIDTLNCLTAPTLVPTVGSFQTIFAMFSIADQSFKLENNQRVNWPVAKGYEVNIPGRADNLLAHPWGGGMLPLYFEHDPRVRNVQQLTATQNRAMMEMVLDLQNTYETEIKHLPTEEKAAKLAEYGNSMQATMPPRENKLVHRCLDIVHGSGSFDSVTCEVRTSCGYITTGALQAATASLLIGGLQKTSGFSSACQAVGHNELANQLKSFGLVDYKMINS